MQPLSNILPQAMSNADLPKEPQLGLMTTDGTTSLVIQPRTQPLTENELTVIASKTLLRSPVLYLTKKKIYGRKEIDGYWYEDQLIGEEDEIDVSIPFRLDITTQIAESALRSSPPQASLAHLTRLSMHKRLGSSDTDRAVLLHDYAEALRPFSDFIVFLACRCLWESDENPFYPKIKPIARLCELLQNSFERVLNSSRNQKTISSYKAPPKFDKSQYYATPQDNTIRRVLCDFLIEKGEPDYFNSRSDSNYQLEMIAKCKGWKPDEGA